MEKLVLNLTLKEITIRKVVIHLWNTDDSFDSFLLEGFQNNTPPTSLFSQCRDDWLEDSQRRVKGRIEWREVLEKVKVKVRELRIPATLEKRMMLVVKPIGLEMLRGKLAHIAENLSDSRRDADMQILKRLCWTNAGQIDYEKTAENLVHLETLDVVKRFKLACLNYLADCIPDLWDALPEKYQKCFEHGWAPLGGSLAPEEIYWYETVKDKQPEMNPDDCQKAFKYSAIRANKVGTKYFFPKLSKVERDSCLCSTVCEVVEKRFIYGSSIPDFFPKQSLSGVMFYLLTEMNAEEQKQVFQERACHVIGCFLDWPLQDLLPDIADVVWPYIPESKFIIIKNIIKNNFSRSGYYFPDVFQNFFRRSPAAFRKFFVENDETLLLEFFTAKDADTIEVILRSLDVVDRVRLMSNSFVYEILNKLLIDGSCDFVKQCLRVVLESAEGKESVKRKLMSNAEWFGEGPVECRLRKWKEVFESLEEDYANAVNKRSSEDETSTRVKRPRTEEEKLPRS